MDLNHLFNRYLKNLKLLLSQKVTEEEFSLIKNMARQLQDDIAYQIDIVCPNCSDDAVLVFLANFVSSTIVDKGGRHGKEE